MKKNIVVLGAGFGGLRTTISLARKIRRMGLLGKYQVILVDQNDHHTYTPLLYEVATAAKETASIDTLHEITAYKIRDIIASLPILFVQKKIVGVDLVKKFVKLESNEAITYEYLVVGVGSETNFFNIKGLKEHALKLKTFEDAIRVREALWNLDEGEKDQINVVIGGAGSTGIELAGEIKILDKYFEEAKHKHRLKVSIVEAAPSILPGFDARIIEKTQKRLQHLDVSLVVNEKISELTKENLVLASGKNIPYDIFVWTGGVKASNIVGNMGLKMEERGRVEVVSDMECLPQTPELKLYSKIYGLGDAVCFYDPITKRPIPGVARAAIMQGNIVAHNIVEDIKCEQKSSRPFAPKTYHPMSYPYIIPIGGKYAIAKVGPFVITGFFAWVFKGIVELTYLLSVMPIWQAIRVWFRGFKIFIANDRLG
jgi:NADH dehydrogenase